MTRRPDDRPALLREQATRAERDRRPTRDPVVHAQEASNLLATLRGQPRPHPPPLPVRAAPAPAPLPPLPAPREPLPPLPEAEMRARLWEAMVLVCEEARDVAQRVIDAGGAEEGDAETEATVDAFAASCRALERLCDETRATLEERAGSWADAHREHPRTSRLAVHVRHFAIHLRREIGNALDAERGS